MTRTATKYEVYKETRKYGQCIEKVKTVNRN